jgi:hypothetical protein
MRSSKSWFATVLLAVAGFCFALPQPAHADTYQIVTLSSDGGYFFYGMNASGTVVLNSSAFCFTNCYDVYINGVLTTVNTPTAPSIVDDQGTPCTPAVPSGGSVIHGVCNNGREAFTGRLTTSQVHPGIYTGPNDALLMAGGEGFIFMNSVGDIVFDDHFTDDWYEAIDLTSDPAPDLSPVPEPNPALLVVTGLLGLAAATRRCLPTSRL